MAHSGANMTSQVPGAAAAGAMPSVPAWTPPKGTIERLKKRRKRQAMLRALFEGRWREVLIDLQKTQHLFRSNTMGAMPEGVGARAAAAMNGAGERIGTLLVKLNIFKHAMRLHADLAAANAARLSVPPEYVPQREAIEMIRERCMFDGLLHQSVLRMRVEGEAAIRTDVEDPDSPVIGPSAVMCLDENDVTLPMGSHGADGQPRAWERRWIIERPDPLNKNKPKRYLRVERHRVRPDVGGVVEQEAYRVDSADVLVELAGLPRVQLTEAITTGAVPAELTVTGLAYPLITQLALYREAGEPVPPFTEHELDMFDAVTAALSRIDLAYDRHSFPMIRIGDEQVAADGTFKPRGAIRDPNKVVEFIESKGLAFADMLNFLERVVEFGLMDLEASPALLGVHTSGSSQAETLGGLILRSTNTLASAKRNLPFLLPAIGRAWTITCQVQAGLPMQGFDVAPVKASLRIEIPKSALDLAAEQTALLASDPPLTSHRRALAVIHGDDQVDSLREEIGEDVQEKTDRNAAAFSAGLPKFDAPDPERESVVETPPEADPQAQPEASGAEGVAPTADRLSGIDAERAAALLLAVSSKQQSPGVVFGLLISMGIPEDRAREMVQDASSFTPAPALQPAGEIT